MIRIFAKIFGTYYNSNYLSYKLRKLLEKTNIRKFVGLNLASTMFIASVFIPQTSLLTSSYQANNLSQKIELIAQTQTDLSFSWPLQLDKFQISQGYKIYHPGLDLSSFEGEEIKAVAKGKVMEIIDSNWGYGKHIIISHENGYQSLYAHLSKILVKIGDEISQGQVIGVIGNSGWSTGTHLHIEIHSKYGTINPLEIFPKFETEKKVS